MSEEDLGASLKRMRLALCLTQTQLAELLQVRQGTLSRWEAGKQSIPRERRYAIIDLLANTSGALSPVLDRLCRRRSDVSVWTMDHRYARIAGVVSDAMQIEKAEAIGAKSQDLFEDDPKSIRAVLRAQVGPDYLSQISYLSVETDFVRRGRSSKKPNARLRANSYSFGSGRHDRVLVTQTEVLSEARGLAADIGSLVLWSDFDV